MMNHDEPMDLVFEVQEITRSRLSTPKSDEETEQKVFLAGGGEREKQRARRSLSNILFYANSSMENEFSEIRRM